jgi:hypothetical protein
VVTQNLISNPGVALWLDTTDFWIHHSETQFVHNVGWFTPNLNPIRHSFFNGVTNLSINWQTTNQVEFHSGKGVLIFEGGINPTQFTKHFFQTKLMDSLQSGCFYKFEVYLRPKHKLGIPH